jgi:hypothetical protein
MHPNEVRLLDNQCRDIPRYIIEFSKLSEAHYAAFLEQLKRQQIELGVTIPDIQPE